MQADMAAGVFNKNENFDPTIDPSVRVQFSRLRSRLEEYYSSEGINDPIRFLLSPRGYAVRLERAIRGNAPASETGPALVSVSPEIVRSNGVDTDRGFSGSVSPTSNSLESATKPNAVAVLPLANLTNDADYDVVCHGLTDELISAITPWEELEVLSRSSSFQFGGEALDVRTIGSELGVGLVLEGSVRLENGRMRITVQLSSTESGFSLWSESFDEETDQLLRAEKKLAGDVLMELRAVVPRLVDRGKVDSGGAE
jgi:TolB-like protein